MNTAYDLAESAILVSKLLALTRNGKVEWLKGSQRSSKVDEVITRFHTKLEDDLEASVWSTTKSAGFRVFEKSTETGVLTFTLERDLISVTLDHDEGASRGEVYVNLISLLELARRSADKVEPKIDRVKQYLDKLAV